MYGMGVGKLAAQLVLSNDEAKALMAKYHQRVPFVKTLAERVMQRAAKNGKIRTISGRLCRFDMWEPKTFGYSKPMKHDDAEREYAFDPSSVYLQGIEPINPRFGSRPDKESDGRLLRRGSCAVDYSA